MVYSSPPPLPQMVRSRPMAGAQVLSAEHASWRLHRALRGRDFADERVLRQFITSHSETLQTQLPPDASAADRAQELFYLSREASSHVVARRMRRDALKADPVNIDVLVDCAVHDRTFDERLALLEEAVVLGEARRAKEAADADDEERGWGVLSSRPGLRARAKLALHLVDLGRLKDAIDSCQQLLELDPSDSQGARYLAVALLLEVGRHEEALRILAAHHEESCAIFAWAKVLLEWELEGDAEAALKVACNLNEGVEETLLRPDWLDGMPSDVYGAASPEEAEIVSDLFWRAWHKRPAAIDWLRARVHDDELREVPEGPVWERILEADEEELRPGLLAFLVPAEEATITRLRQLVAAGPDEEQLHVAEWAAFLLGRLGVASAAVPELIAYLRTLHRLEFWNASEAMETLVGLGASVVRPLLDALAEESHPSARYDLLEVLARTGVQNEEVFAVLVKHFHSHPILGSSLFTDYGDPRALPLLSEHLDQADPDPENRKAGIPDLIEAVEELGGSLSPSQQERFADFLKRRAYWDTPEGERELEDKILALSRLRAGGDVEETEDLDLRGASEPPLLGMDRDLPLESEAETVLSRPDRPGRNEPCWCGSGKKYKRCHLNDDEDARP